MLSLIREKPAWYSWLVGGINFKECFLFFFFFLVSSEFLQLCVPSWWEIFEKKVWWWWHDDDCWYNTVNQYTLSVTKYETVLNALPALSHPTLTTQKGQCYSCTNCIDGETEGQIGEDLLQVTQVGRGRVLHTCCNVAYSNNTLM